MKCAGAGEGGAKQRGGLVEAEVTPKLTPSNREATFEFPSKLAQVVLRFSATTNRDVTRVILNYDLRIIPILMQFENSARRRAASSRSGTASGRRETRRRAAASPDRPLTNPETFHEKGVAPSPDLITRNDP
jgi:hypothetical protein